MKTTEEWRDEKETVIRSRLMRYKAALEKIAKGEGRFDQDPLVHCGNAVEDMKLLATEALNE